jgi:hypothetical protein
MSLSEYEVVVPVDDIRSIRALLNGVLTYFQAEQISRAARAMTDVRPYPITLETERLAERVNNILGDHLLALEDLAEEDEEAETEEELPPIPDPTETKARMLAGPNLLKARELQAEMAQDEDEEDGDEADE